MMINTKPENFVTPTKKMIEKFKSEYDRYHDNRYYLTKVRRNGRFIWGLKMFKRARQIAYWKRRRLGR